MTRGAKRTWLFLLALFVVFAIVTVLRGGLPSDSVLIIELKGPIEEQKPQGLWAQLFGPRVTVLHHVTDAIDHAKTDDKIAGLVVKISTPEMGWAKIQEIRAHLLNFRKSNKPSICYLHGDLILNRDYYLATACDQVWMVPTAPLGLTGLMTQSLFFRGTLDKLRIYPDMYGIQEYKTARNQYTEKKYTPAHREMAGSILRSTYDNYVSDTSEARKIDKPWFEKCLREGPYVASEALERKLVDNVAHWDKVRDFFRNKTKQWRPVELARYAKNVSFDGLDKIAVVHATGTIIVGESDDGPDGSLMGSETVSGYLRRAREDSSIKAIVLRVDSPGGSAVASEIIRREVQLTREAKKPIVVSMSDVAGSGGYWISMSADKIVADQGTLTGSIGVVFGKFNVSGLYNLIGLSTDRVTTSDNASFLSAQQSFTPQQQVTVQKFMRQIYDNFKAGVAEGRKMKPEDVEKIARGRVWTGSQGKGIGLVDEIGGFDRALKLALELAKLDPSRRVKIVRFPEEKTLWQTLLAQDDPQMIRSGLLTEKIRQWIKQPPSVQVRMPFDITIR